LHRHGWPTIAGIRILCLAAKWGPNALFCVPNRTKCILVISVRIGSGVEWEGCLAGSASGTGQ
jgi:hypothetical protein